MANASILSYFLCLIVLAANAEDQLLIDAHEEDWDYEPKIWHQDEDQGSTSNNDFYETLEPFISNNINDDQLEDLQIEESKLNYDRKLNHYLNSNVIRRILEENQEECTQFRVDIREAIICDKSRCDKLDFEWPKFTNQMTIIQTTKHGMRFHREDYAFEPRKLKIKFDLMDLIKPFTPTTTTTTTTTTAPTSGASSASPASSTTEASTSSSSSSSSTTTTTISSTAKPKVTASIQDEPKVIPTTDTSQDSNHTQLVTTFRLDTKRVKQKMIGFGGALSDSTCRNIKSLSPKMAKSLMEDYYGERGLRYNIVRMSMGSSDFSTTPYTNNDQESTSTRQSKAKEDTDMINFRLTSEDLEFKIPVARQAIATSKQELKFFSSLWSPPIWMKNNSHIVHGYLKGDIYGPYYRGLAEYMVRWFEAYRKQGIEFWATTGLNEPVTGVKPFIFHNSLGITRDDYVLFFKLYLGPMMRQRGFSSVKLIMLDDNKGYAHNWVKAMLEDQEAAKYISGIAFHWYMNDEFENLNFLDKPQYKDKFIISSEACNGFLPFQVHAMPGDWDRGIAYMLDIIKMIQKNAAAWVDWNMALNLEGGPSWANNLLDAAIIVNGARDEYYKSPMFYAMGHFSRFVERDSQRLDYIMANAKYDYPLEAVAFLTPRDYIVIVALNANKYPVPFKIIVNKQLVKIVNLRADSFSTIIFNASKLKL